ncbi:DUF4192 domain-containing protein [Pimelobacter simplex]|uniref:DUF4192 domain-containing protein n=1 Tax=Nocardioides simplex TaxID=2045 RepID=UPI003AAA6E40
MTTASPTAPTTATPLSLTAHEADDLLAVAPVLLGFWPERSIVMLTLGGRRPFHARIDLPPIDEQSPAVRRLLDTRLLVPARRHGAVRVVLLYFTDEPAAAAAVHRALRRSCARRGLGIVTALLADGTHYRQLEHPDPTVRRRRHPYDISAHPFVRDALASGRLVHPTRDAMVDSLAQRPAAAAAVTAALVDGRHADHGIPTTGRAIRDAGRWALATVTDLAESAILPTDADLARLLWVMQAPRVRDAAWSHLTSATASAHLRIWSDAVRRAPDPLLPAPAALLAWAAWQSGDGALAWAALDRCRRTDPTYRLAAYLALLLENAVSPDQWSADFDWSAGLPPATPLPPSAAPAEEPP